MDKTRQRLKTSTVLPGNPFLLRIPSPDRDFSPDPARVNIPHRDWETITIDAIMQNFTSQEFATTRAKKLKNVEYTQVLNEKGAFQRAFVTVEILPGKFRMFEITYQYFDADVKNGKVVRDSTGFKMCAYAEYVLPHSSKAEADKIKQALIVLPDQPRNLVKDENGKTKFTKALGGWEMEVGGGYNAYHIEKGRYPLQWKNMLGIDGKPHAIDDSLDSLSKLGLKSKDVSVSLTSDSMGASNVVMAKYLLEKKHGFKDVACTNIVPMGLGQSLKQLTELEYNLRHPSDHFQTLQEIGKTAKGRAEAVKILRDVHGGKEVKTVVTVDNYFPYYNVNGSPDNNAATLPGSDVTVLNTPRGKDGILRDTYVDHLMRLKNDHLLGGLQKTLDHGPTVLSAKKFTPAFTDEDLLFSPQKVGKNLVETSVIETLHTYLYASDRAIYGIGATARGEILRGPVSTLFGTSRDKTTTEEIMKGLDNYKDATYGVKPQIIESAHHATTLSKANAPVDMRAITGIRK